MDIGQDTTLSNGDVTQKLVQLLVIADGELKMTGDDTRLLVVSSGIASQFKNFGSQILKDSGEIDGGT
jgi:hypothetical protein